MFRDAFPFLCFSKVRFWRFLATPKVRALPSTACGAPVFVKAFLFPKHLKRRATRKTRRLLLKPRVRLQLRLWALLWAPPLDWARRNWRRFRAPSNRFWRAHWPLPEAARDFWRAARGIARFPKRSSKKIRRFWRRASRSSLCAPRQAPICAPRWKRCAAKAKAGRSCSFIAPMPSVLTRAKRRFDATCWESRRCENWRVHWAKNTKMPRRRAPCRRTLFCWDACNKTRKLSPASRADWAKRRVWDNRFLCQPSGYSTTTTSFARKSRMSSAT